MSEPESERGEDDAHLTKAMEHLRAYVSIGSRKEPISDNSVSAALLSKEQVKDGSSIIDERENSLQQSLISGDKDATNPQRRVDPFTFGTRLLTDDSDIYDFNAWDHVEVDPAFVSFAELQYAAQRANPVSEFDKRKFNATPEKWWNTFYKNNTNNFFKDRKWLFQEFPVLTDATAESGKPVKILEVGAGAGNTAFPILKENRNPGLKLHACDYAPSAVKLMRNNHAFDSEHMQVDTWDVASSADNHGGPSRPPGIETETVDIVILIFVMSALAPSQWTQALRNIHEVLKPGGHILFRDYGRGDLAQVRFKKGRYLDENFYIRGDGTRVYFFEENELRNLFGGNDFIIPNATNCSESSQRPDSSGFEVDKLAVDRRLLVNRQRKLKMYRCWMQGQFRKRLSSSPAN